MTCSTLRLSINTQQSRKHSTGMKIVMYQQKKTESRNSGHKYTKLT